MAASISAALSHVGESYGPQVVSAKQPASFDRRTGRIADDHNAVLVKPQTDAGLKPTCVYYNLSVAELYEKALANEPGTHIVSSGALATLSGLSVLSPLVLWSRSSKFWFCDAAAEKRQFLWN